MAAAGDLERYRAKRDFARTPEPSGEAAAAGQGRRLVIQKHAARRLHYDLRLQIGEVLKSWAVPKGPSLDPADKRLAVHVEDHPLDYGSFEGVIPEGQYGAGTVMLWDEGTWAPEEGDAEQAYASGRIKFNANGKRMRGRWMLVRMHGRRQERENADNWLLVKEKDRLARPGEGQRLVERHTRSIASRRTMEGIAAAKDRVWRSNRSQPAVGVAVDLQDPAESATPPPAPPATAGRPRRGGAAAERDPLPEFVEPQLARRYERPPQGTDWVHEIKLDGYRLLARKAGPDVRLLTRHGLDWTARFPGIARAVAGLALDQALLDGEAAVLLEGGRTSFADLQAALKHGQGEISYGAFDLLYADGEDLRELPLIARKQRLEQLLAGAMPPLRFVSHLDAAGDQVLEAACELVLEGVISKRRDAPYRSGRSDEWRKSKCLEREEFVVIGFTDPKAGGRGIGSLVLATHDAGTLVHVGRVGTGFDQATSVELRQRLERLATERAPVAKLPAAARRGVRWVEPRTVVEVEFQTWTGDGMLRHASFQGVREDKEAGEVRREHLAGRAGPPGAAKPRAAGAEAPEPALATGSGGSIVAGVKLTNPDKVLWPSQGITKLALATYLEAVAEHLLRHAGERPLSLVRCPEGRARKCFFQKHGGPGLAKGIKRVPIREKDGSSEDYLYIDNHTGLVGLAQMGVLELHPWGSRIDDYEKPDRLIFDLDPDEGLPWGRVAEAALELRQRLAELGLTSFLKTTGGKGLHVVVPILRRLEWGPARDFAKGLSTAMVHDAPDRFVATMAKAARRGKIFIDWMRNQRGATAVAAFSPRAREGAPVAMPVEWETLEQGLDPKRYDVITVPDLLAREGDPWHDIGRASQGVTAAALRRVGVKL